MKKLHPTTQYKKDYKRFRNNPNKLKKLMAVLNMLQSETQIPSDYYPHMLTGNYAGYMECHIEGDFLLIWFDPDTDQIDLVRLGSHSNYSDNNPIIQFNSGNVFYVHNLTASNRKLWTFLSAKTLFRLKK